MGGRAEGTGLEDWRTTQTDPFLTGRYAPVHDELNTDELAVTGELPAGLRGTYYRNGPNPQFEPMGGYHLFDGDGMVHAVRFGDGAAQYFNRWVASRGLQYERAQGAARYPGLGNFKMPDPATMAGGGPAKNVANTGVVFHGGKLLALFEGAAPTELGTDLTTVGVHDYDKQLRGPFSAHPKVDARDGRIYTFGNSPMPPYLTYYVIAKDGTLAHQEPVPLTDSAWMHDFAITESDALFFDTAAVYRVMEAFQGKGSPLQWCEERGSRIGVMPRAGGADQIQWYTIDNCSIAHVVNAYRTGDQVVVDAVRSDRMLENVTGGGGDVPPMFLTRWTIDTESGQVEQRRLSERGVEMPTIHPRCVGRRHRYAYLAHYRGAANGDWPCVMRHDFETGDEVLFDFGAGKQLTEPLFVPASTASGAPEDDGWLLTYVYDEASDASVLAVLRADDLAAGPVAEVQLPRRVPFGFHGTFVPAGEVG